MDVTFQHYLFTRRTLTDVSLRIPTIFGFQDIDKTEDFGEPFVSNFIYFR